uniref:Uncharacterized protein n=2 Tax=Clostridium botulinum TaxID=1491 RepID=A0A126JJ99_CLOBO|nr:Rad52_Rad22 family domain containing partial hypothetical protein [Clostridium botulinum]ALT05793.1 Rad52_Rad22 family domain containing partial hypothetical protein [Clostridium botulinum]ALT05903.1 Rad52_Rad22 family domain containing partial hypothetical protein [Clostridium botulinum]
MKEVLNMKKNLIEKLQAPFSSKEINFKIANTNKAKTKGLVVPYVNNSAIQNRLDDVFTPFGWQCSFKDWKNGNAQICTISIYDEEKNIWISKEDGAENSEFSPIKGGLSDSMKRSARMFGVGRYLASEKIFKNSWVDLDEYKNISPNDIERLKNEYNQFLNIKKVASSPTTINNSTSNAVIDSTQIKTCTKTNAHQNLINKNLSNNVNSNAEQAKHTIPKALIDVINGLLQSTNTNRASMLEAYGVKNLADLTLEQANDAIKRLAAKN